MNREDFIKEVVFEFYKKATSDFLIGYQFRKIQEHSGEDPLKPPIEAFKEHLPRIENFWRVQLLGENIQGEPFDLIYIHQKLNIKKGELGRWIHLFQETLLEQQKKYDMDDSFTETWLKKVKIFEKKFNHLLF